MKSIFISVNCARDQYPNMAIFIGIFRREMHDMVYFNVEMQDNINMRKDKIFCAAARFFGLRAVFGIFWPEGGRRPSEGQKNPKNRPKAKKPG